MEVWKEVKEFEGEFEVSNTGCIRRTSTGNVLKTRKDKDGYETITLKWSKGEKNRRLHRLVCEAFHGEAPKGKNLALHGPAGISDNSSENLRWGSQSDNMRDRSREGKCVNLNKTHCPKGHPYSEENTLRLTGKASRTCKTCRKSAREGKGKGKRG